MLEQKTIDALRWILGILGTKDIPYQISGGFAAKMYGSIRQLNDIDIDIPEDRFDEIMREIGPHITYGPSQYRDGKWDLVLITLDFHGQEIDISGAYDAKVSNKERTAWLPLNTDLSDVVDMEIEGLHIKIATPERMIAYKRHLDGEHQLEDIAAMEKYLNDRREK